MPGHTALLVGAGRFAAGVVKDAHITSSAYVSKSDYFRSECGWMHISRA